MISSKFRAHLPMASVLIALLSGPWHTAGPAAVVLPPGHHRVVAAKLPVAGPPAPLGPKLGFEYPRAELPQQPTVASLAIPGRGGAYIVPYIQTQPDLHFKLSTREIPLGAVVTVTLDPDSAASQVVEVAGPAYEGAFSEVPMGEHTLLAEARVTPQRFHLKGNAGNGDRVAWSSISHVARGDIIAALGDSTTEGNGGPTFGFVRDWVAARAMAADWTSPDGRNYPQAGGLSHPNAPASFTSTLGTILSQLRGHPVLVLNDGWSGATAEAYSHIASSGDLAAEYAAARPNSWVINLGVNDPLTQQTPEQFNVSMHTILQNLIDRFGAHNGDIHVACPSYSKDARHDTVAQYLPVVDQLRASAGLGPAPNFFAYFKGDPAALADEVHPNAAGYRDMAVLWAQALGGQNSSCS